MSQLNFFLTPNEMNERLSDLLSTGQFQVFNGVFFHTDKPDPVSSIDHLNEFRRLIIWVNNMVEMPICASKGQGDYEGEFRFDYYKQPIIEVDNCNIINKLISPGRIYYKAGWIDDSDLRKLHKKMAEKVKRHFTKGLSLISPPFKASTGIKELILNGYEIELGEGGKRLSQADINNS